MHTKKFYNIGKELFPFFRSITGKGTLKTLKTIKKIFPDLKIRKLNLEHRYLIGLFHLNGGLIKHIY